MRILVVVYCFPPLLVPASICYLKLVVGLNEAGYDTHVLCIDPDSSVARGTSLIDASLGDLVPDGVTVHEVLSWERNPLSRLLKRFEPIYQLLYRLWEPSKKEWLIPALRFTSSLDLSSFDIVLTCSQPHVNHLVGLRVKQKTGKPWIAYLSDPWTDAAWEAHWSPRVANYHAGLERKVVGAADVVLFTSAETVDLVMKKYDASDRTKCGVLPHCYIPNWYERHLQRFTPWSDQRVTIVHTGHFYGPRSPEPALVALERLATESPDLASRLHVQFYGSMADQDRARGTRGVLKGMVTVCGTIPYLETLARLKAADYLLMIDAPLGSLSESVFLPSKLVDYLGTGKPIIGITPSRGTSTRVLREVGHTAIDVEDGDGILEVFRAIARGDFKSRPDATMAAQFDYRATIRILDDNIRRLVKTMDARRASNR